MPNDQLPDLGSEKALDWLRNLLISSSSGSYIPDRAVEDMLMSGVNPFLSSGKLGGQLSIPLGDGSLVIEGGLNKMRHGISGGGMLGYKLPLDKYSNITAGVTGGGALMDGKFNGSLDGVRLQYNKRF